MIVTKVFGTHLDFLTLMHIKLYTLFYIFKTETFIRFRKVHTWYRWWMSGRTRTALLVGVAIIGTISHLANGTVTRVRRGDRTCIYKHAMTFYNRAQQRQDAKNTRCNE